MKYTREIEAILFTGDNVEEIKEFVKDLTVVVEVRDKYLSDSENLKDLVIRTSLHDSLYLNVDKYLIKQDGLLGYKYKTSFEQRYKLA